jgi:hypothetical protein
MAQENEMTIRDMGRFKVKGGKLLWDGEEVQTEQQVSLRWFELTLASFATVATATMAAWPIIEHFWLK